MTDFSAADWVRTWSASMSARAAAAQELSDEVARLAVSASDHRRTITVTVNGSGCLTGLLLEPEAAGWEMDRLAEEILRTMRRAQAKLAERVTEVADRTVGSDTETARAVVSGFERRFPPADGDERPEG